MNNLIEQVEQWFKDKGLENGKPEMQMLKLFEEHTGMVWGEHPLYDNWLFSEEGHIFALPYVDKNGANRRPTFIKTRVNNDGYEDIKKTVNGSTIGTTLHRVLAEVFIPNPDVKETVNHKDGDKLNNNINNLEWATRSEQLYHAYDNGLREYTKATRISQKMKMAKPVKHYSKETEETKYFLSARDCSRDMGYSDRWCDKIISSQDGETRYVKMEYVTTEEVLINLDKLNIKYLIELVEYWFIERNLHTQDPTMQLIKCFEELGELAEGLSKDKPELIIDALGDVQVVLIGLHLQLGYSPTEALEVAYNEIKGRTGQVINGTFVKEEDL